MANHSYSHTNFFPLKNRLKVQDEIKKTNKLIESITQQKNTYFRPPFGVTNPIIAKAVKDLNMIPIGWSLRSYDTVNKEQELIEKLKHNIKARDIVLMHELESSLIAIDKFIEYYKAQFTEEEYEKLPEDEKPLKLIGNSKINSQNLAKAENKKLRTKLKEFKEELNVKVKNKELKRKEANEIYKEESTKSKELQAKNLEKALEIYEEKIKNSKVLVSNYGLLSAGFDKEDLSHIIFGSPIIGKVTVLQSIGRIVRVAENKQFPLVQFFFTSTFLKYQTNANMILRRNILSEFTDSEFEYKGF